VDALCSPVTQAGRSLAQAILPFDLTVTMEKACEALNGALQCDDRHDIEDILLVQVHVLDAVFNRLLMKGLKDPNKHEHPSQNYVNSNYIRNALQAQNQCRRTIGEIRQKKKSEKFQKRTNELNRESGHDS